MKPLEIFRTEILRWNRSISLVSRRDPELRTDRLIEECVEAGELLRRELASRGRSAPYRLIDLGTGGGFPGLLWAESFRDVCEPGFSVKDVHLVEPRDKRAWFLEQTARAMALDSVHVHAQRWGERIVGPDDEALPVISMKALHLSDLEVREGLRRFLPNRSGPLTIVRFVNLEEAEAGRPDPRLGVPGDRAGVGAVAVEPSHLFLPLTGLGLHSSLLLSDYPSLP